MLSAITWNNTAAPTGGLWKSPVTGKGAWSPPHDNAVIDLTSTGTVTTGPNDSVRSLSTNASTTVSVSDGSLSLGAATSTINGSLTVSGSGTLAISGTTLLGVGALTDGGNLTAANSIFGLSSTTMSSGSALNAKGITIQTGAELMVAANVNVLIDPGTIVDDGTINLRHRRLVSGSRSLAHGGDHGDRRQRRAECQRHRLHQPRQRSYSLNQIRSTPAASSSPATAPSASTSST